MDGYQWAEQNIDARLRSDLSSPRALQECGVQVYFAPQIPSEEKLVNLRDGRVERFLDGEDRPGEGYFAGWESLERFCRREGVPLNEVNAQAVLLPAGDEDDAGDPLRRGGR